MTRRRCDLYVHAHPGCIPSAPISANPIQPRTRQREQRLERALAEHLRDPTNDLQRLQHSVEMTTGVVSAILCFSATSPTHLERYRDFRYWLFFSPFTAFAIEGFHLIHRPPIVSLTTKAIRIAAYDAFPSVRLPCIDGPFLFLHIWSAWRSRRRNGIYSDKMRKEEVSSLQTGIARLVV